MPIEKINAWKNYLLTLTDERFFSILRSYLGPIKSPYNKQKLLESLQTFLSQKDIQKKITLFLDTFDKEIISAILILENPTEEKLISFFSGQYSLQEMDEKLSNLTDRLIIYLQSNNNLETFCINPVVEEIISPFVSAEYIFPTQHIETKIASTQKHLSIEFITSVLSYIFKNPDLVKMDGKLKKSSIKKLEQIFPEHFQMIDSLILSFINMDLLKFENKCLVPQWHNIKNFTKLSRIEIISYICLLTDCDLYDYLFQDILELLMQNFILMKDTAFTKNILIRKVFLQKDVFIGKFKRFLYSQPDNSNYKVHFFKKAIERAEEYGIIIPVGKNKNKEVLYKTNPKIFDTNTKGVLTLDASFRATLIPHFSFSELFDLIQFLDIIKFDTTVLFELTKESIFRAFDNGFTQDEIFSKLKQYSNHDIPQNVKVSIEDWQEEYSSVNMYKGYILLLNKTKAEVFEKNKIAMQEVKQKITDGVYLMNFFEDEEAKRFLQAQGFLSSLKIKTIADKKLAITYKHLSEKHIQEFNLPQNKNERPLTNLEECENKKKEYINHLKKKLKALNLSAEENEKLLLRINQKLILDETQLSKNHIKLEISEASGMDFTGKVHIVERAIQTRKPIELKILGKTITGKIIDVQKKAGEQIVTVKNQQKQDYEEILLSKVSYIKILETSAL